MGVFSHPCVVTKKRQIKQRKKETNKQTNKQKTTTSKKVSIEIPKVYLFSCSGRLLSSVRCDKETRDEHQTKKARALGKSENLFWNIPFCFFIIL